PRCPTPRCSRRWAHPRTGGASPSWWRALPRCTPGGSPWTSSRALGCACATTPWSASRPSATAGCADRPACPLGPSGGDAQPVAVGIGDVALAPREPLLVHLEPELLRHGVDVVDVEVDERVRSRVALVLRQVEAHVAAGDGEEPREAGLELVPPLLVE